MLHIVRESCLKMQSFAVVHVVESRFGRQNKAREVSVYCSQNEVTCGPKTREKLAATCHNDVVEMVHKLHL